MSIDDFLLKVKKLRAENKKTRLKTRLYNNSEREIKINIKGVAILFR